MKKEELLVFLDTFYEVSKIPLFMLNEKLEILHQSSNFISIHKDAFHMILPHNIQPSRMHPYHTEHEIYTLFSFSMENQHWYLCVGPVLFVFQKRYVDYHQLRLFQCQVDDAHYDVVGKLPYMDSSFIPYLEMIYGLLFKEKLQTGYMSAYSQIPYTMHYEEELYRQIIQERKQTDESYTYEEELKFLQCIKQGDGAGAKLYASKIAYTRIGKMSEDELRKNKYALVAAIAIITRAVIEVGVRVEDAYALSDMYIMKVDEAYDYDHLFQLNLEFIMDFCSFVRLRKNVEYPLWIRQCMDLIDRNLHTDISLKDLADHVHLVPTYVSVQFKKIYGKSIRKYINDQKIKEAKFLLRSSNVSIQDIAFQLNYANQSYFAKVFKEITGVLPNEYRLYKSTSEQ